MLLDVLIFEDCYIFYLPLILAVDLTSSSPPRTRYNFAVSELTVFERDLIDDPLHSLLPYRSRQQAKSINPLLNKNIMLLGRVPLHVIQRNHATMDENTRRRGFAEMKH